MTTSQRIIAKILENGPLTTREVAKQFSAAYHDPIRHRNAMASAYTHLSRMKSRGWLEHEVAKKLGYGNSNRAAIWALNDEGRRALQQAVAALQPRGL